MYAKHRQAQRHVRIELRRAGEGGAPIESFEVYPTGKATTCLPEGDYSLTLAAVDDFNGETASAAETIRVEDILIIAIGDSYASGEGNPEFRLVPIELVEASVPDVVKGTDFYKHLRASVPLSQLRFVDWADDGSRPELRTVEKWITDTNIVWGADKKPSNLDTLSMLYRVRLDRIRVRTKGPVNVWSFDALAPGATPPPEHVLHKNAHRSTYAATSQMAHAIERDDPHTSVTYVNLAATGATIPVVREQLENIERLVGSRQVDALIISVGGNDVGFGPCIHGLLMHDGCLIKMIRAAQAGGVLAAAFTGNPELAMAAKSCEVVKQDDIADAIASGQWSRLKLGCLGLFEDAGDDIPGGGMQNLDTRFDGLKEQVDALQERVSVRQVLITEYPTVTERAQGTCPKVLTTFSALGCALGVFDGEAEFAAATLLNPLNSKRKAKAEQFGWTWVDGIHDESRRRGLCEGEELLEWPEQFTLDELSRIDEMSIPRWFRRARESLTIQGARSGDVQDTTGTAHPNEYGHKSAARLIRAKLLVGR